MTEREPETLGTPSPLGASGIIALDKKLAVKFGT